MIKDNIKIVVKKPQKHENNNKTLDKLIKQLYNKSDVYFVN